MPKKSTFLRLLAFLLMVVFAVMLVLLFRMRGPYRSYRADARQSTRADAEAPRGELEVGTALREITPDLTRYDAWTDADGNSRFEPENGDTYADHNENGTFDFVWLGGFDANRPAQGVNDPLWTRAIAFRNLGLTVAMVTIDCVGLTHERFIRVRQELKQLAPQIDYVLFSSTHTHNSPDTLGIWSYRPIFSKFDETYVEWILDQSRDAVLEAVSRLEPVNTVYAVTNLDPTGFVRDSREPIVVDRQLCAARFIRRGDTATVATLVSWGNHPESMGGSNPLISSDFPHYLREALEKGLPEPGGFAGFGGTCLFFQGPVGGLMTPLGLTVPGRDGKSEYSGNGIERTRALGENLAVRIARSLNGASAQIMESTDIAVVSRSVFIPIEGTFKWPILLGLIHPGWYDGKARTEVSALRIGDIEILNLPGEIYPEIVDGGVESPEGADYPGEIQEAPPLRSLMRGKMNLVINLANDEIGYIIPRTQWDTHPPFTYGHAKAPYGEVNSGGVEVAGTLHQESMEILGELHQLLEGGVPATP